MSEFIQFRPTQADISAEVGWLESLSIEGFQSLGEGRSNPLHRIFISELNLFYDISISVDDVRVTVTRFVNLNGNPRQT